MEEKDFIESNEKTSARGVKRSSEIKIAEVTTSKKKRAKKPTAEATEPNIAQNLFEPPYERTEEDEKLSRLKEAARDVAEGNLARRANQSHPQRMYRPQHSPGNPRSIL
jgi:hypothetical protein